jgi:hypothetical protein
VLRRSGIRESTSLGASIEDEGLVAQLALDDLQGGMAPGNDAGGVKAVLCAEGLLLRQLLTRRRVRDSHRCHPILIPLANVHRVRRSLDRRPRLDRRSRLIDVRDCTGADFDVSDQQTELRGHDVAAEQLLQKLYHDHQARATGLEVISPLENPETLSQGERCEEVRAWYQECRRRCAEKEGR